MSGHAGTQPKGAIGHTGRQWDALGGGSRTYRESFRWTEKLWGTQWAGRCYWKA